MRILSLSSAGKEEVANALKRPTQNLSLYRERVRPIIDSVRNGGDKAVLDCTKKFDGVTLKNSRVSQEDIRNALQKIPKELLSSISSAKENISRFQNEKTLITVPIETQSGVVCWREIQPIQNVGLYVPGGTAPLVSTALMLSIPAALAQVPRIVLCSPPQKDGKISDPILAVCALMGIDEVYMIGGAQAIAAMAYGTETIRKVDKIAGPGNVYVAAAKAEVSIDPDGAAIDMLAGPSELMVIADGSANPSFVAADLLSQAEHDPSSQVILLSTSAHLLAAVQEEIADQLKTLPRREIAAVALAASVALLIETTDQAVELANAYAPEHLSIQLQKPEEILKLICNAGSIFLGSYSPETVGDYCSGTNHVLPTSGSARVQGGVSVRTFQKVITVQRLSKEGLGGLRETATTLARTEQLEAHARAVDIRFSDPQ